MISYLPGQQQSYRTRWLMFRRVFPKRRRSMSSQIQSPGIEKTKQCPGGRSKNYRELRQLHNVHVTRNSLTSMWRSSHCLCHQFHVLQTSSSCLLHLNAWQKDLICGWRNSFYSFEEGRNVIKFETPTPPFDGLYGKNPQYRRCPSETHNYRNW